METTCYTPQRIRAFQFSVLCEYSEAAIRERVAKLTDEELNCSRSALINRLHEELIVQMPNIEWGKVEVEERKVADTCWEFQLVAPMRDRNWLAWSITWPPEDENTKYEPDPERNRFAVTQRCYGNTAEEGRCAFEVNIGRFHVAFEQAAKEVERFNAAIPYLLSLWIEARIDDAPLITEVKRAKAGPGEVKAVGRMLDKMVADGDLTFVQELDPATGKLRKRYFHPDRPPKAS